MGPTTFLILEPHPTHSRTSYQESGWVINGKPAPDFKAEAAALRLQVGLIQNRKFVVAVCIKWAPYIRDPTVLGPY